MSILNDKRGEIRYESVDEIIKDLMRGKKKFVVEVPNSNIQGLDLEFCVNGNDDAPVPENEAKNHKKLSVRLVDGGSRYCHYEGWSEIGKYAIPKIAEKLVEINKGLQEQKYKLQLESISHSGMGSITGTVLPYYRIKEFSVNGKRIAHAG